MKRRVICLYWWIVFVSDYLPRYISVLSLKSQFFQTEERDRGFKSRKYRIHFSWLREKNSLWYFLKYRSTNDQFPHFFLKNVYFSSFVYAWEAFLFISFIHLFVLHKITNIIILSVNQKYKSGIVWLISFNQAIRQGCSHQKPWLELEGPLPPPFTWLSEQGLSCLLLLARGFHSFPCGPLHKKIGVYS